MIKIILKSGKDDAVKRFHPWIFSGAIKKMYGAPVDGDLVYVYNNKDEFLALGHYQNSSIAVRIISFEDCPIDLNFWTGKIRAAYEYRKQAGITNSEVYRLIHAEGDGLPGLIVDYYNGHLVLQCHSIGMHKHLDAIAEALKCIYSGSIKVIYDKSSETLPRHLGTANRFLFGQEQACEINENGCRFAIDYVEGQKTGFFIDQRENRLLLQKYCEEKTVLNTFCYTGGFSIYALKGGAALVHSVDSSKKAIALTDKNVHLNGFGDDKHKSFAADTLEFIKSTDMLYDIIILDPPAYAKHNDVKHNAVQGYKRLNQEAIQRINTGGLLFTFSCSQVVSPLLFKSTVIAAAISAERKVRIMHQLSQPPDHPINAFHPEGEYLKGLVVHVT